MTQFILTDIRIYPIKSLGGIRLQRASVLRKGLRYDRRWMLIDENNVAMTQRVYPQMALFRPEIHGDVIQVNYDRSGTIISSTEFNVTTAPSGRLLTAKVWDDSVEVVEIDTQISKWFSHHIGINSRLVTFPERNPRPVNPRYAIGEDHVSLADAYPFLIIGEAALEDLNRRLSEPVPMNRFRPNFVFSGGDPNIEDTWKRLVIGTIPFAGVKKSDRCVLTTVDQETARKGTEPLHTLSGYRKIDNKVYFGQNMIALKEGTVTVGDVIIPG